MIKIKDTLTYPFHKLRHSWAAYVIMLIAGIHLVVKWMPGFLIGVLIGFCALYLGLVGYKLIK